MIKLKFKIDVVTVCGGQESIDEVNKKITSEAQKVGSVNAFKIIFMDCSMPVMDGFEASKQVLEITKDSNIHAPYIVALTGYDD